MKPTDHIPATPVTYRQIKRVSTSGSMDFEDAVAVEEPLEIRLLYQQENRKLHQNISVTMRTPGNDTELAAGFLFTEGIIKSKAEVESVALSLFAENLVLITLAGEATPNLNTSERNFYTTSSCGICGKASIDAIRTVSLFPPVSSVEVKRETILMLGSQIAGRQNIFENTGGLHASSLFTAAGNFQLLREDVGRHNALDKLIGAAFLADQLPLSGKILLLSGRSSFELIQKSVMAGIEIVVGIGAPSSLAIALAEENNMTLIGFLKEDRFNVYTGFHRITDL